MATVNQINSEHDDKPYISDQETNTGSLETAKMENEEVGVQPTTNIPELPNGKQHHVFISYAEVDQEFAYKLIGRLENVGYKICHHNKDFTPGWPITDNIKHCVMGSMKTIVILSNGFIASPWCRYETEITFYMSMEMRKKILIPLAIENCKIPDHLKPLTRIEYYNDKVDWWTKLLDAVNAADMVPSFQSDLPAISSQAFGYNPSYFNLDTLVEVPCNKSRTQFSKRYLPKELSERGIQVTQQEYEEVKDAIKRHAMFECDCCFSMKYSIRCLSLVLLVSVITGLLLMREKLNGKCSEQTTNLNQTNCLTDYHIGIGLFFIPLAFYLTCCLPCRFIRRKKTKHLYRDTFSEINRRMMKHKVMVSGCFTLWVIEYFKWVYFNYYRYVVSICHRYFLRSTIRGRVFLDKLQLYFVYYDYQPCLDRLRTVLRKKKNQTSPNESLSTLNTKSGCKVTKTTLRDKNECQSNACLIEIDPEENIAESSKTIDVSKSADSISVQIKDEMKENNADNNYEEEAKFMLLKHSGMYLQSFKDECLPTSKLPRHTRTVICLCQYVEIKEGLFNIF